MIENRQFRFNKDEAQSLGRLVEEKLGHRALRWYIAQVTDREVVVEATVFMDDKVADLELSGDNDTPRAFYPGKSAVVSVIPTGVGCEVGGYAGDAAPATRLLSAAVDYVITNPNAVNASNFVSLERNTLYTEGLCIDHFCKGKVDLHVTRGNRVGLIVEKTTPEHLEVVYNVVNTARAVYGVDMIDCVVTDEAIGSRCVLNESGAYVGTVDRPEEIYKAAQKLIDRGAQAIGITTNIQDLPHDEYVKHFEGQFPNPMGGVEAIMSHMVVNRFEVPSAHAPMINLKELALVDQVVDARGAGEMVSQSGLCCVLIGLAQAPRLQPGPGVTDILNVNNLLAVVAPASCLGGIPTLYADRAGVPIIAVRDNSTVLDVTAAKMGFENVIEVQSYAEAAGILLALREGIAIDTLTRPMRTMRPAVGRRQARRDAAPRLALV